MRKARKMNMMAALTDTNTFPWKNTKSVETSNLSDRTEAKLLSAKLSKSNGSMARKS